MGDTNSGTAICLLQDRGFVQVSGPDARAFLDNLITNSMDGLAGGDRALFAGLLTPQGKILFEFLVVPAADGFLLDVNRDKAADLVKRLTMYRLRSKVEIGDASSEFASAAVWGGTHRLLDGGVTVVDPRSAEFCHRLIGKPEALAKLAGATKPAEARTNYDARRVEFALAEAPHDYPLGDTFPHEANWDLYGGVSFTKGCYVGQEVVSRMQNKTVVRKRVVRVTGVALTSGAEIMHGAGIIGTIGTVAGDAALALVRLDRAAEARNKGETLICNGNAVAIDARAIADYELSVANRPVIDL